MNALLHGMGLRLSVSRNGFLMVALEVLVFHSNECQLVN